jgi:hypothetical protein
MATGRVPDEARAVTHNAMLAAQLFVGMLIPGESLGLDISTRVTFYPTTHSRILRTNDSGISASSSTVPSRYSRE